MSAKREISQRPTGPFCVILNGGRQSAFALPSDNLHRYRQEPSLIRGRVTITDAESAQERRQYVADAWADTAVTVAAVTAAIGVGVLDYVTHHKGIGLKVTILAAEFGTALLVIDHVAKMVWYRTFIGSFLRWLWRLLHRSGNGTGGGGKSEEAKSRSDSDHHAQQEQPDQQESQRAQDEAQRRKAPRLVVETYRRSWTVPVVASSHVTRFTLAHPLPGSASVRTMGSVIALMVGGLCGGLFGGISGLAGRSSEAPVRVDGTTIALATVLVVGLGIGLLAGSLTRRSSASRFLLTLLLLGILLAAGVAIFMTADKLP
jgi:hypothetical protein